MIMARNEDGTYSQVGFVKDNAGIDTEYIYDKDGDIVFEKGFTREISGTVPLTINGIGKDLKAWSIIGNTVQNGTPTPENPVEVQAVGDRTGNLFDYKKYFESTFTKYNEYFEGAEIQLKPFTTYTFATSFGESTISTGVINTAFIITTSTEEPRTLTGGISSTRIATKTTEADGIIKIYKRIRGIYLPKKEDFDSGMHWLMINEGDTALPYEPYGYKIPVVTRGKNLFDKTAVRYETAIGGSNPVFVDYPGSASFIIPAIKGIKNYTLKVKSDVDISIIRLAFYDKPIPVSGEYVNNMKQISDSKNPIVTSSNENNLPYIVVQISGAFVNSYGLDTIQLEIGDTATPYEPYHEPITTPIYLDSPLYKIGDYADRLSKTEEVRVVKELVLTGEENITQHSIVNDIVGVRIPTPTLVTANSQIICTHALNVTWANFYGSRTYGTVASNVSAGNSIVYMSAPDREHNTLSDIKSYLAAQYAAGTPVKVYYVMQTPETKTVEPVEIPTLNGTTVIDVDTAVKPTEMYTKYKSSK